MGIVWYSGVSGYRLLYIYGVSVMKAGYISRSGVFYECPHDCASWEGHILLCQQLRHSEDFLLNCWHWVKLTFALGGEYIFSGVRLSPEQVLKMRELGIEPDEWDLP